MGDEPMQRINVMLGEADLKAARTIGGGNVSEGLRLALAKHKDGTSVAVRQLRAEIARRRKANHDERMKRNWNPDAILKIEQTNILDWIESELEKIGV